MDEKLKKIINEVHSELQKTHPTDSKGREILRQLDHDLRVLRDCEDGKPLPVDKPFLARLREARDQFEVSHPGLTKNLSHLLDTLSTVGV